MSHLFVLRYKGVILEEYPGRLDAVRGEIIRICSQNVQPAPDPAAAAVVPSQSDGTDTNLSGAERLLKRRRLSGDQAAGNNENGSESLLSTVTVEMANYEKMQVCTGLLKIKCEY